MTDPTRPALPYVLPMAGFLLLTALEGALPTSGRGPDPFWYPLAYTIKVAVVAGLAWACRSSWRDLAPRPAPWVLALAAALGLVIAAASGWGWTVVIRHSPSSVAGRALIPTSCPRPDSGGSWRSDCSAWCSWSP